MSISLSLKNLSTLVKVLETYRGRDRIIRLATYVAMFMGGEGKTASQLKWRVLMGELSSCRVILRLFDDLPMLMLNLSTGFGLKGKNPAVRPFDFLNSVLFQAYFPAEHIGWLRQKKILSGVPTPFMLLGLFIWAISLASEIIKSIIKLRINASQTRKLFKQQQLDKDRDEDSSQNAQIKENIEKLAKEKKDLILAVVQSSCDLTTAIAWCPPGFLWSQKLSPSTNAIFGGIATLIMLYRNWPSAAK